MLLLTTCGYPLSVVSLISLDTLGELFCLCFSTYKYDGVRLLASFLEPDADALTSYQHCMIHCVHQQ